MVRPREGSRPLARERVLQALVALEQDFGLGIMAAEEYRGRRAALLSQLSAAGPPEMERLRTDLPSEIDREIEDAIAALRRRRAASG